MRDKLTGLAVGQNETFEVVKDVKELKMEFKWRGSSGEISIKSHVIKMKVRV